MKIGLCLSGGGVRGIAHIGVLQALEEAGIVIDALSGASAGAIVATLYAAGFAPKDILQVFKESSLTKLFKLGLPTAGLTDNTYIIETLGKLLDRDDFAALRKPVYLSVTNLSQGTSEIRHEGPLFEIVAASSAIPILFETRSIDGQQYVDGGVLNNLPAEPLRETCDLVIGVNVTPIKPAETIDGILQVGYRTLDLVLWSNVEPRLRLCDVVISPDAGNFGLFELWKADEIYQIGYQAAQEALPALHELVGDKRLMAAPPTYRALPEMPPPPPSWWRRRWAQLRAWFVRLFKRNRPADQ
ncbi:MAG: patatin-like phospholipase family protein [Bacteroidia bacterium]